MNETIQSTSHAAVPLLLGVTGHQDIDPAQFPSLREAVRTVFEQLRRDYPNSPLILLSPLVAGADQLVAEVVLELTAETDADVQLVAVLPWPSEWEVDDRSHWGDRSTFERLLSQASQVVTLPLTKKVTEELIRTDANARDIQRDEGGRHVARHSQILIALWDENSSLDSHTSKVVHWQSNGGPAPFTAKVGELDMFEGAAVCHLPVCRTGADSKSPSASESVVPKWIYPEHKQPKYEREKLKKWWQKCWFAVRWVLLAVHRTQRSLAWWAHDGMKKGERQLRDRWQAIDRFNRDTAELPTTAAGALLESRGYLIPEEMSAELPECVRKLRDAYSLADTSASTYQTRSWWIVLSLFVIAFIAVSSLEIYAHYWHEWPLPLLFLGLLGTGYALYRWTAHRQHQGRWLDDRALAEALRVQVYWKWVGRTDCVADHYLRHFRGQLDWIRHATRAAFLMSGGHTVEPPISANEERERIELIQKYWVLDQYKFFTNKSPINAELEACFETGSKLSFYTAIGVTVYLIWHHLETHHMSHSLVLATFGFLVLAAMLEEFAEIQTYALLERRYKWMADLFGNALRRIKNLLAKDSDETDDFKRVQSVLFDLGREALAENADWVIQHRQRPPILPKG